MIKLLDNEPVYTSTEVDNIVGHKPDSKTAFQHIEEAESDIASLQSASNSLNTNKASNTRVQEVETRLGMNDTSGISKRVSDSETEINNAKSRITTLENNSATSAALSAGLANKADVSYATQTREIANANANAIGADNVPASIKGRIKILEDTTITQENMNTAVEAAMDANIGSYINDTVSNSINELAMTNTEINEIVDTYF